MGLFFHFFQRAMNAVPVQTTLGQVELVFVERIEEQLDPFFSFQIVCIPNSEFVIVQPSRHFLRNSNMEAVLFSV
jgi:hypothetical protein